MKASFSERENSLMRRVDELRQQLAKQDLAELMGPFNDPQAKVPVLHMDNIRFFA